MSEFCHHRFKRQDQPRCLASRLRCVKCLRWFRWAKTGFLPHIVECGPREIYLKQHGFCAGRH